MKLLLRRGEDNLADGVHFEKLFLPGGVAELQMWPALYKVEGGHVQEMSRVWINYLQINIALSPNYKSYQFPHQKAGSYAGSVVL